MSIGNVAIRNVAIVPSRQSTDLSHDVASARAAVKECRAHHRCSVLGCLWRMDFSCADARMCLREILTRQVR